MFLGRRFEQQENWTRWVHCLDVALEWFKDYLYNRFYRTKVGNILPNKKKLGCACHKEVFLALYYIYFILMI